MPVERLFTERSVNRRSRTFIWIARCNQSGSYFNPREIVPSTLRQAARKDARGGMCGMCAEGSE